MWAGFLTRLRILIPFPSIGSFQSYCPHDGTSHRKPQNVKATCNRRVRKKARFAIIEPAVFDDDRALQVNLGGGGEQDAVLLQIDPLLSGIELDLHDLLW